MDEKTRKNTQLMVLHGKYEVLMQLTRTVKDSLRVNGENPGALMMDVVRFMESKTAELNAETEELTATGTVDSEYTTWIKGMKGEA